MSVLWGIDLGGTKIEGIVIDTQDNSKVHFRERMATEAHKGYDHILHQIASMCSMMKAANHALPEHVGIGTPGTLNAKTQTISGANTTCLNGRPLKQDLESLLGIGVEIANDANCFALAESLIGVGAQLDVTPAVVFGIIMGTGVGSGIIINGKILNGHHGIGGEWGHNYLDREGGPCYCGRQGCVETIISGPALESHYFKISGHRKSLKQIAEEADIDSHSKATIDRLIHYFGMAVGPVVNIIDPDLIILGGGVGNIPQLRAKALVTIAPYVFHPKFETTIATPILGDSAGVFGAAML